MQNYMKDHLLETGKVYMLDNTKEQEHLVEHMMDNIQVSLPHNIQKHMKVYMTDPT